MLNLNCVICAELFSHSDDVHVTSCGHMFHLLCLKQWMERSKSCPQCRNKCTERNVFRVYFNLANLDASRIDVGSLQEQLDNAQLSLKMKEQELNKASRQIKDLKDTQRKSMKTIHGLEQEKKKNDFIVQSYNEQLVILKNDAKTTDNLRKEVKSLQSKIETLEAVSAMITASQAEAEALLKTQSNPEILASWYALLKRELRQSETKRTELRHALKVVQNDYRREMELKKQHEERISHLESENYQLNEKINTLEAFKVSHTQSSAGNENQLNKHIFLNLAQEEKRLTISPTIKANVKKIEESSSPYFNIKSSSVGLAPLFKRNHESVQSGAVDSSRAITTTKITSIKVSPSKTVPLRKNNNLSLSGSYSILKKPRLGMVAASASAGAASMLKPLGPNYVFNGFGGSEKADPFARQEEEDDEYERPRKVAVSTVPKVSSLTGRKGLKNFQLAAAKLKPF